MQIYIKSQEKIKQNNINVLLLTEQIGSEKVIKAYKQALKYTNLALDKELFIRNVRVYEKDHIHQICTVQDKCLPHLVLIHGYGGTSLNYLKMFQTLKPHYQIHALDLFGMGLSSLGAYSQQFTAQEVQNYYIDALQKWRNSVEIQTFTLVGHSLGAYLAAFYAEKYPEKINRLILLSPPGNTYRTKQQIEDQLEKRKAATCCSRPYFFGAEIVYNWSIRPSKILSTCFFGYFFAQWLTSYKYNLKGQQKSTWKQYLRAVYENSQTSQSSIYKLFKWPIIARKTIEEIIEQNKFKFRIQFYFGDRDWIDMVGAKKMAKKYKHMIICQIIANCGHQMNLDNPKGVCEKILRQDRSDK